MKKRSVKLAGATAVVALLAAGSVHAAEDIWTGLEGDGLWGTSNNWSLGTFPTSADWAHINNGETVTYLDSYTNTVQHHQINSGSTFNFTGGKLNDSVAGNTRRTYVGTSGEGTLNMTGGQYDIGHILRVGIGGTGVVNLDGGNLNIYRGGNSTYGHPSVSISFGNSSGSGTFNISGGSLTTRTGIEVGENGVFHVIGGNATVNVGGNGGAGTGDWWHEPNGVLKVTVDASGTSPIILNAPGEAWFEDGSLVEVAFADGYSATGTWPIMGIGGDFINLGLGLTPESVTAGWQLGLMDGTNLVVSFGEDAPELPELSTPLAPANLLALPTAPYLATLTWDAALSASSYTIKRASESGGPYTDIATGVTELTYEDTGLTVGEKYYYVVTGVNAEGEGLPSAEAGVLATQYTIISYGVPYGSQYSAYAAFDDNTGTHFDSETVGAWVGLDFGTGNAQQVRGVSFVLRNYNSAVQYATNATFEGANQPDFSDAVLLATVEEPLLGNPNWNSYVVTDTSEYRYVRLNTAPSSRTKSFAEVKFLTSNDFTTNGTPKIWLEGYGLTEADDEVDNDGDGLLTWEEYFTGTIPTDSNSVLVVNSIVNTDSGLVLSWQSVEGKSYSILTNTSLNFGGVPGVEGVVIGLEGETSYTGTLSGANTVFYEIAVDAE
ncbi:fibronectin type III domain-containing protein [Pontiellaceae bacterium B1224]|nr:fibronectin type III domain-containing protein [Pontiellaceae bacterium B1224]